MQAVARGVSSGEPSTDGIDVSVGRTAGIEWTGRAATGSHAGPQAMRSVLVVLSDTARIQELVDRACQECGDPRRPITLVGWSGSAVLMSLCSTSSYCVGNTLEDARVAMQNALAAARNLVPQEFDVSAACEDGSMRQAVMKQVTSGHFSAVVATSRACSALSRGRCGRRLRELNVELVSLENESSVRRARGGLRDVIAS